MGLGDKFLRHIERCKILIHLIDIANEDILEDYLKIRIELSKFSEKLLKKKEIIVLNKIDIVDSNKIKEKTTVFKKKIKKNIYKISVMQNKGLISLKKLMVGSVHR